MNTNNIMEFNKFVITQAIWDKLGETYYTVMRDLDKGTLKEETVREMIEDIKSRHNTRDIITKKFGDLEVFFGLETVFMKQAKEALKTNGKFPDNVMCSDCIFTKIQGTCVGCCPDTLKELAMDYLDDKRNQEVPLS